MTDFGIKEALLELGLKKINEGTSTGSDNFSNGEIIESYSPVDGKLIGKVKSTTKQDYEKVMESATKAVPNSIPTVFSYVQGLASTSARVSRSP